MSRMLFVLLSLAVGFPALVAAQAEADTATSEFAETYLAYKAAREAGNLGEAMQLSGEALRLGREVYGEINENTATLAQNYAVHLQYFGRMDEARELYKEILDIYDELYGHDSINHVAPLIGVGSTMSADEPERLDLFRRALSIQADLAPEDSKTFAEHAVVVGELLAENEIHRKEAIEFLEQAVELLERDFGDDAPQLVPVLMALGKSQSLISYTASHEAADSYRRALFIVRKNSPRDRLKYADVSYAAGRDLFESTLTDIGIQYLEEAYDIYSEELGGTEARTAATALLLGRNYLTLGQARFAERRFLEAIAFYKDRPEYAASEVQARTLYIHAVGTRNPDEDVTEHLIALAELTTRSDNQEYLPLLKVSPVYPNKAGRQGWEGYVITEFTVDETGRTTDAHVIESSNSVFERSALEAVSEYRYVPRIVDGERVPVYGVRDKLTFKLVDFLR